MDLSELKKLNIPTSPGVYQFFNSKHEIIYIGKAANLKSRILSYLPRRPASPNRGEQAGWRSRDRSRPVQTNLSPAKFNMLGQIAKIKWIETDSEIEALLLESNLIKKHQPYFNVLMRDDKRFCYIKISLEDEIPGVFITRKIEKSGRYFGPFTSALAVRETLRAIRKIFPYCTMRRLQKKPCFYYQIGRCMGVCGGKVSREEYMKQAIKPLILFLEGKKKNIIKNYELRIRKLEKNNANIQMNANDTNNTNILENNIKEIETLKYQLANMKRVLESANIISVAEKYANDVVELAKLLSLPKVPERIEGYDISNIFGREAVGSMVVFSGGEPDKGEYRKFKIRIGSDFASAVAKAMADKKASSGKPTYAKALAGKRGDVQMLKEVLERRFRHPSPPTPLPFVPHGRGEMIPPLLASPPLIFRRGKEIKGKDKDIVSLSHDVKGGRGIKGEGGGGWPSPDLIIIDGGKAQVNVASRVLKKYKLDIPVIAISKGEGLRSARAHDKLFFPGEKKPLELPLASPALHLIKRVRDEAHRFAIGYHRKLRSRNNLF